jgi:8-oxo-dGTP pyrophosphatase MutT (NUDIX family)
MSMKSDPKQKDQNPWTTLSSETRYDNNWITVTEHRVLNPAESPAIYGEVHFKNIAIGILPIDENGFIWLVGQYRYPLKAYSWEIPEGGGKITEPPLETAKRELKEETGLEAAHWEQILEMHLSNSVTDERALVFLAMNLTEGASSPEETEVLSLRKVSLADAQRMVDRAEITDAISVAAILKAVILFKDRW